MITETPRLRSFCRKTCYLSNTESSVTRWEHIDDRGCSEAIPFFVPRAAV